MKTMAILSRGVPYSEVREWLYEPKFPSMIGAVGWDGRFLGSGELIDVAIDLFGTWAGGYHDGRAL